MGNSNKTLEQLIGERIGMRRTQLERTQQDIADYCNVKRETINQWENGSRQIKAGDLLKLSKALDCTVDFLTTGAAAVTHDLSYIVEQTGLSDKAIGVLAKTKDERNDPERRSSTGAEKPNIDFISRLIEDEQLCRNLASLVEYIADYELPDMSVPGNRFHSDMEYVVPGLYFRLQMEFTEFIKTLVKEALI